MQSECINIDVMEKYRTSRKKHNISKSVIGKCLNTDLKILTIMSSFQKLFREAEDSENFKHALGTGGHKGNELARGGAQLSYEQQLLIYSQVEYKRRSSKS